MLRSPRCRFLGGLFLLTAACSSSKSPATNADSAAPVEVGNPAGGAGGEPALVGGFVIDVVGAVDSNPAHTTISGRVADGPTPSAIVWDLLTQASDCRLSKPRAPFCNPACGAGEVCTENNACGKQPVALDVGTVTVRGLGDAEISLTAISKNYMLPGGVDLPFPPAPEGSDVDLVAAGGPLGAFSIRSSAVAPLVLPAGDVMIQKGAPLTLTWQAGGSAGKARIEIAIDISSHGGYKGKIDCDTADDGSLQIGADLITQLVDLGVAGFPEVSLTRVATGSTLVQPGRVRLRIASSVARLVKIPGLTSCHDVSECPAGKACQQNDLCEQ